MRKWPHIVYHDGVQPQAKKRYGLESSPEDDLLILRATFGDAARL